MNLTNFLKQTDILTAQYSTEQLIAFIHDIGRVLPEAHREDFLKRLKSIGEQTEKTRHIDEADHSGFHKTYQQVRENLKIIDSQELTITGVLNEEYDDWYDDSGEEFYYEDESGISDMLAEACAFVHTCVDQERYQEGFEIGKQLFYMEIACLNEYGDEQFSIEDMVHEELLHCNIKQVILDTLYCAYQATPIKERPEELYEVFVNAGNNEVTLELLMQRGDEDLPDFQEFLPLWITYLGNKTGCVADGLFQEANCLMNDVSVACEFAEKFAAIHPGLYLNIIESERTVDLKLRISIGIQAVKSIPKKYVMRSKVALKTADNIIRAKEQQDLLEKCYFAAYESDTSAVNYIRVLLNGYGTEGKREELRNVFTSLSVNEGRATSVWDERNNRQSERAQNNPDRNMILMLRFLDGQFAEVLTKGLNKSEALGWTGTFMKQGIALYLLYLYEGRSYGQGMLAMARIVKNAMGFSVEDYQKGLSDVPDTDENDLFYNVFSKWKSMTVMEPDIRTRALKRIKNLIEKRTEGIMNANHRNYYRECAAYIAALGEVQESLGDIGAKQRFMTSYKDKYPRRSAFRAEMKGYGWHDIKKK